MITYMTKGWAGDMSEVIKRHKEADVIIGNNLDKKYKDKRIVDIGGTGEPYYIPELEAVKRCKTKYILWYAGDVIPHKGDWLEEAIKLLEKYPIVRPSHMQDERSYRNYVDAALSQPGMQLEETEFGYTTVMFSDHGYIAKTKTMQNIDYDVVHQIRDYYPLHGGNSFERRVAQWLATNDLRVAIIKDWVVKHISKEEK